MECLRRWPLRGIDTFGARYGEVDAFFVDRSLGVVLFLGCEDSCDGPYRAPAFGYSLAGDREVAGADVGAVALGSNNKE